MHLLNEMQGHEAMIVDLRRVPFIDVDGLDTLKLVHKRNSKIGVVGFVFSELDADCLVYNSDWYEELSIKGLAHKNLDHAINAIKNFKPQEEMEGGDFYAVYDACDDEYKKL